jgi:transcriptional regulator with XRE-family HTH domain
MSSPTPLSDRLRLLRTEHFGKQVIQKTLSSALKVSAPTISSWENGVAVPSVERIEDIARFFASPRSVAQQRLLDDAELTAEERLGRDRLAAELLALRPEDPAESDFWKFSDGGPVRIICGQRDPLPPEADPDNPNFMALTSYADLDSLVELFGHVRACNPTADVRFARPDLIRNDDLHAHLVVLGNVAAVQSTLGNLLPDLPVTQIGDPKEGVGEVFEATVGGRIKRFEPVLADGAITEDVGFLARMPSPTRPDRTLTLCSGVYTRGVYGAVRCLTDQATARQSHAYLRTRFAGETTFGLLMRVLVVQRLVSTPRLDDVRIRLFEFP